MIVPLGLDISADLTELGRTPIAVISAGVKSILDIGRTLEFLVRIWRSFWNTIWVETFYTAKYVSAIYCVVLFEMCEWN